MAWRSPANSPRRPLSLEFLSLAAGCLVVGLAVVAPHPGRLYLDTRPDLYLDPGSVLAETMSTWVRGTGLGTNNYGMGYLPVAAIVWCFQAVGIPPWLSMRLWRWLLYVVAGLGARALYRSLSASEDQEPGRFAGFAVFGIYVINPYVIAGANTTPIMLPYALLPWLLLALRRGLRPPHWWVGPLAFGVVFFLMSGINAGVVSFFLLSALPLVALDARLRERIPWWHIGRAALGSGVAAVLVSAYWLAGTFTALGAAASVAEGTEDPQVVASVTSFSEVSRGLGSWLLYGADQLGPYLAAFTSYLTNPLVVIASFAAVVLALAGLSASRSRLRPLALSMVLLGLVLMAGSYPPENPSPFGRAMAFGFDHVPFLLAFRTTFKAGPIAFLGMALLVGLGARAWWPRVTQATRFWSVSSVAILMALSVTPALIGRLYPAALPIPDYWNTAIDDLDEREPAGRVWVLPGETNATYRWRTLGVDDFFPALIERGAVYHRSFPNGPAAATNASTAVDQAIETGTAPSDLVSTYARYLGAGDVLVRNDMVWEITGAARPSTLVDLVEGDSGLRPSALYGEPGEGSTGDTILATPDSTEMHLPPLLRYSVVDPRGLVSSQPVATQLLISGSNEAIPGAVWDGILTGSEAFRISPTMSDAELSEAISEGALVVVTDTNRRHAANDNKLFETGPLLPVWRTAKNVRALGDSADQTTVAYEGVGDVTASSSGSIFGPTPTGRPFLAIDGDDRTGWTFGDFGRAKDGWIQIDFVTPRKIQDLTLDRGPVLGRVVRSVRVEAGGRSAVASFAQGRTVRVHFDQPVSAESLRITVLSTSGSGINQVALNEISVPGLDAREVVRTPTRVTDLAESDPALLAALAHRPPTVIFSRAAVENERSIDRRFSYPVYATTRLRATVMEGEHTRRWRHCHRVGSLDGEPVKARVVGSVPRPRYDFDGKPIQVTIALKGCGATSLTTGSHDFRSDDVRLTHLAWTAPEPAEPSIERTRLTWHRAGADIVVDTEVAAVSTWLFVAEAYEPRWEVTVDGQPQKPVLLNGYGMGVQLPAGAGHHVELTFAPQRPYPTVVVGSVGAAGLCLVGAGVGEWLTRRRRRAA